MAADHPNYDSAPDSRDGHSDDIKFGGLFRSDFGLFYHVTLDSGALRSTTDVIDTYVYRGLIQLNDLGMASAANFYQSVVGFFLVIGANSLARKLNRDTALF